MRGELLNHGSCLNDLSNLHRSDYFGYFISPGSRFAVPGISTMLAGLKDRPDGIQTLHF